jgi:DNA-binding MarR family transcriptional regulator
MIGFVKLNREILEWEWYTQATVSRVYFHLLLKANFESKKWQGILIPRGQLITSLAHLSSDLQLSVQQIRTALDKLEKTNYITRKSHHRYTFLTWKEAIMQASE